MDKLNFIKLSRMNLPKCHQLLSSRFNSTKTALKVSEEENTSAEMKQYEKMSNITIKKRKKSPQKPPFAKNLFLGIFDTDILSYPELESEELKDLEKQVQPVSNYFNSISPSFAKHPFVPKDFISNLKQLQLFGLQTSQLLNGRELDIIGNCKFTEVMSSAVSVTHRLLHNEHLGIQLLLKNGNEDQQKRYLQQMIDGNIISAFCVSENDNKNLSLLNTTVKFSQKDDVWVLNGKKTAVVNGSTADLYIVIGQTSVISKGLLKEPKLTAVLVDKDFPGVTFEKRDTLGMEATDVADVTFDNVIVPKGNVIGTPKAADAIVSSILTEYRLNCGAACSTLIRKIINNFVDHCKSVNMGTVSIAEADYVAEVTAEMALTLYALESATYLTAGLLDFYENQDCLLESTIIKVFSADATYKAALKCMDIIGSSAYMKDHWCNILLRDALSYRHLDESTENLKLSIALLGIQHAGLNIQDSVSKMRNPLSHAAYVFKRMWFHRKQGSDNPNLRLQLGDYLHPSFHETTDLLEYGVLRLQYAIEILLGRYGSEIINQHMDLKRIADSAIDIFMMIACLARASRSYCIGLENANYEMVMASIYCSHAKLRIQKNINDVVEGIFVSGTESNRTIAKRVFKYGKYFPEHPLSRNY